MNGTPGSSVVLVDTRDIPGQITALLSHLTAMHYDGLVVLMTVYGSVPVWLADDDAASRLGAAKAAAKASTTVCEELVPAYVKISGRPFDKPAFPSLIGISPPIEQARKLLPRVADHDRAPVLILGPSGTGKQVIARGIHEYGPRGKSPFVEVNCTALQDTLLESELFGRERGAYTDANTARRGLIETASDGSLFLDEIGHMTEKLQMALLKVIEQRTFRRVGGNDEKTSNTRFMAATSRDLEQAIEQGDFRGDLYYRLNVFTIHLPALSERDGDVLLLAHHYARQYAADYGREVAGLTGEAALMLLQHQWPGNVRELKNITERAVVLHDGEWLAGDALLIDGQSRQRQAPAAPAAADDPALQVDASGALKISIPPWGISLEAVERAVIEAALQTTDYNISKTAKLLFISRDTLRYRIKKFGIDTPREG